MLLGELLEHNSWRRLFAATTAAAAMLLTTGLIAPTSASAAMQMQGCLPTFAIRAGDTGYRGTLAVNSDAQLIVQNAFATGTFVKVTRADGSEVTEWVPPKIPGVNDGIIKVPLGTRVTGLIYAQPDPITFGIEIVNSDVGAVAVTLASTLCKDDEYLNNLSPITATEPMSGQSILRVPVSMGRKVTHRIGVDYTTVPGTAVSGADFQALKGTLFFQPGDKVKFIEVPILADKTLEGDESFQIALNAGSTPTTLNQNFVGESSRSAVITIKNTGGANPPTQPPSNKAPSADYSFTRVDGTPGKVNLDAGASSDPDGSITKYEWLLSGSVVATGKTASYTFGTANRAPSVSLRVTDNAGAAATMTKTLSLPNRAPVIGRPNPADGSIVGSNRPNLSTTVTDPDGDVVGFNYRITGYMVDKSSGPVSGGWTVPASTLDPGTKYNWTVTVTDGQGGSASANRNLTVAMLPTAADVISTPSGKGYWQVASDGGVFSYGDAQFYGSVPGIPLKLTNIMGMARTPSGKGYWVVGSDGGVFSFGDAGFYGSAPGSGIRINNVVDMVPTKTGRGYWLVASDGGVFSFGDAQFFGSMGGKPLNKPVVSMSATASGNGYWLVGGDGGIFSFGDAPFYGSMGGQPLSYPVVDMDTTPDGSGYWMTAEDGGVFAFGNAQFYGSMGGKPLNGHVTGMAITPTGKGYWLNACDGGIFTFGDAPFLGANATYMCRGTNQP